jgi:hypothetical protein
MIGNFGHGHVFARPDGAKARCGGPGICSECARDAGRKNDPRHASTLGEACKNPDGTHNGYKLLSWLSGMPEEEVKAIADKVIAEKKAKACAGSR